MILFEKLLANVAKKPKFVHFEDPEFEKYCIAKYDKDGDGKISIEEANKVVRIDRSLFAISTDNFSDLRNFNYANNFPNMFYEQEALKKIKRIEFGTNLTNLGANILGFTTKVVVVFHGKTPPKHSWSFSNNSGTYDTISRSGSKIYVPDESVEDYKKAFTSQPYGMYSSDIILPMSELNK